MTETTIAPAPQINLPGQVHVAEGPHDQTGMYLMHHAFRRDLNNFVSAVRHTPVAEAEVWEALAERWDRFADTLHHHHTIEDTAIWPVLLEHVRSAGATADEQTLLAMEAEHEGIDPALRACHAAFDWMAEHPCAEHRSDLDARITAVRELLAEHLAHEESEALPLLQRTMTAAEFEASEKAAGKGYPLSTIPFVVPWALHELPGTAGRDFLARQGGIYVVLYRLFRGRFERAERRAFRYA